jgi:hypothetical protein
VANESGTNNLLAELHNILPRNIHLKERVSVGKVPHLHGHYARMLIARLCRNSYERAHSEFPLTAVFYAVCGQSNAHDMALFGNASFLPLVHSRKIYFNNVIVPNMEQGRLFSLYREVFSVTPFLLLATNSPLASAPPPFPDTRLAFSWMLSFKILFS